MENIAAALTATIASLGQALVIVVLVALIGFAAYAIWSLVTDPEANGAIDDEDCMR